MRGCVSILLLVLSPSVAAQSSAEQACVQFHRELSAYAHQQNAVAPASFEFDGARHAGCSVAFETRWSMLGTVEHPQAQFEPHEGSALYALGWRFDERYTADGPGSSSYVIRRQDVFCRFAWYFEAYVDEQGGGIVTGDELTGSIDCAMRR